MDCHNYSTTETERKKGRHLRMEDRDAIKALRQQGLGIGRLQDRWAVRHQP